MNLLKDQKQEKLLDGLVQQAIAEAVEAHHRQKGESIAVSDEQGKVKIIPAQEMSELKRGLDSP